MSDLAYPFLFKCSNCGTETKVTQAHARDLHPDPDDWGAVDTVLQQRGWLKATVDSSLYCPNCADVAE